MLAERFEAANRAGGVFGRQLVLVDGSGPAAFLVSLQPAGALDEDTAVRIALREPSEDPATRGIETSDETELTGLLGHLRGAGADEVIWIDDLQIGPVSDTVRLMTVAEALTVRGRDGCQPTRPVVILSSNEPLPPSCANAAGVYVSLRGVPVQALPSLLQARGAGRPLHVFAALPLDEAFSVAPALVGDDILGTSRRMTARPSEPRMLLALDLAWRQIAEDRRTLFAGLALQKLAWPTLASAGHAEWKSARH